MKAIEPPAEIVRGAGDSARKKIARDGSVRVLPISSGNDKPFVDEGQESIAHTPRGRFVVYNENSPTCRFHSISARGFAAGQCGKASPFR
jgi:hypothetical protein